VVARDESAKLLHEKIAAQAIKRKSSRTGDPHGLLFLLLTLVNSVLGTQTRRVCYLPMRDEAFLWLAAIMTASAIAVMWLRIGVFRV